MKVAYMIGGLGVGGIETLMLNVFKYNIAEFDFIGIHRNDGRLKELFYSTSHILFKLTPKGEGYLKYLYRLRRLFLKQNVDIVHAQYWLDGIYAWFSSIGTNTKIIITYHGFFYHLNFINRCLLELSFKIADKLCFVSEYERCYYLEKYHIPIHKTTVVYNGVPFDNVNKKLKIDNFIFLERESFKMCMIGSFSYSRSHLVVCKALKILKDEGLNIDFYFIGSYNREKNKAYDECYEYCFQNDILDCVHFVGEQQDVYSWLNLMDLYVYSTCHDSFGLSVIEASSMGIPVVLNDWSVLTEIIPCDLAVFYQSNNPADLSSKISLVLHDLEKYKLCANKLKSYVLKKYSIESHLSELRNLYYELTYSR